MVYGADVAPPPIKRIVRYDKSLFKVRKIGFFEQGGAVSKEFDSSRVHFVNCNGEYPTQTTHSLTKISAF